MCVCSRRGGRSSSSEHGISQMMLLPIWASEPIIDVALLWAFFFFLMALISLDFKASITIIKVRKTKSENTILVLTF